jgi:hypothetical protein
MSEIYTAPLKATEIYTTTPIAQAGAEGPYQLE